MKFKKSSFWIKLVVLVLVVYAVVTLVSLQSQISAQRGEMAELEQRIAAAEQEKQRLENAIANMDTDEGVEEIARSKLGLVSPGEIIFQDVGK